MLLTGIHSTRILNQPTSQGIVCFHLRNHISQLVQPHYSPGVLFGWHHQFSHPPRYCLVCIATQPDIVQHSHTALIVQWHRYHSPEILLFSSTAHHPPRYCWLAQRITTCSVDTATLPRYCLVGCTICNLCPPLLTPLAR